MADITKPIDEEPKVVLVQPVKHWWESKVIWFNAFVILASLITSATPVVGVINAVLRFNTSRGIIKSDTKVVDND